MHAGSLRVHACPPGRKWDHHPSPRRGTASSIEVTTDLRHQKVKKIPSNSNPFGCSDRSSNTVRPVLPSEIVPASSTPQESIHVGLSNTPSELGIIAHPKDPGSRLFDLYRSNYCAPRPSSPLTPRSWRRAEGKALTADQKQMRAKHADADERNDPSVPMLGRARITEPSACSACICG